MTETDATYTLGINKFADFTVEEYKKLLGYKSQRKPQANYALFKADPAREIPDSIDWREKGAVTAVKDQGSCGSCWAFSTTGALEGRDFIAYGKLNSLSEQQLVDCDYEKDTGNEGCNGGDMLLAMQYTTSNPLESEDDYPYKGVDGTCSYDKTKGLSANQGGTYVTFNSTADLKAAIAQGPVSVAIEADTWQFQFYNSGVFSNTKCGLDLDHGVLAVGYGSDKGKDYYIVKNSWGSSWGEKGYIRIAIEDGPGVCGIQMEPVFPNTKAGACGPPMCN